jgi:hypothetical protein
MQSQDSTPSISQPGVDQVVTCIHEGVYRDGLTYGNRYKVLAWNPEKWQLKIHNDHSRARWYPYRCFDLAGGEAIKIVRIVIEKIKTPPIYDANTGILVGVCYAYGPTSTCHTPS